MKNLTNFRKTVETGVDPGLEFKLARGEYHAYSPQSKCAGSQRFNYLQQNICHPLSTKIH